MADEQKDRFDWERECPFFKKARQEEGREWEQLEYFRNFKLPGILSHSAHPFLTAETLTGSFGNSGCPGHPGGSSHALGLCKGLSDDSRV